MTEWGEVRLPSNVAGEINRDREERYGSPVPNMEMLGQLWSAITGTYIGPQMAATMLVLLKVMREVQGGWPLDYQDNLEDICGWVNVVYMCKEDRRGS